MFMVASSEVVKAPYGVTNPPKQAIFRYRRATEQLGNSGTQMNAATVRGKM
jgi:hypothetical protein